jgi:hypothetical protein
MEIGSKPIVESMIDFKLAMMGVLHSTRTRLLDIFGRGS